MTETISAQGNVSSGNECADNGCPGACCKNMYFENSDPHTIQTLTMNADVVARHPRMDFGDAARGPRPIGKSIVFLDSETGRDVYLHGPCPNLDTSGACTVYEKRPDKCKTLEIGGTDCTAIRQADISPNRQINSDAPFFSISTLFRRKRSTPPPAAS